MKKLIILLLSVMILIISCTNTTTNNESDSEPKQQTHYYICAGPGNIQVTDPSQCPNKDAIQEKEKQQEFNTQEQTQIIGQEKQDTQNNQLETNQIFKECEIKQSEQSKEFVGKIYKINKECLFEKVNTAEACKSYLGEIIYEGDAGTIKFEPSDVDLCIQNLAVKTNNYLFCDETNTLIQSCYMEITVNIKEPQLCKKLKENTNDCYKYYVDNLNINKQCKEEANNYLVGIIPCFYSKLDINKEEISISDKSVCLLIEDFEGQEESDSACISGIGAYLSDTNICNQAGKYKADCWIVIARNNPNFSLKDCDKAGVDYVGCYKTVAVAKEDSSICLNLPQGHKTDCLRQIALKINDLDVCMKIDELPYKKGCVNQVLDRIGQDRTYYDCDIMSQFSDFRPNQCFYDVGLRDLDLNACNRIQGEDTVKSECIDRVQHALANN